MEFLNNGIQRDLSDVTNIENMYKSKMQQIINSAYEYKNRLRWKH